MPPFVKTNEKLDQRESKKGDMFSKVFWIRIMDYERKTDLRVDCLALPDDVWRSEVLATQGPRRSSFTPYLASEIEPVFNKRSVLHITMADCSLAHVTEVTSTIEKSPQHLIQLYATTCHRFTVKIDSVDKIAYVDCNMERETTIDALKVLLECHFPPAGYTLCLQRWSDIGLNDKSRLLNYCRGLANLSELRLEQCKCSLLTNLLVKIC